MAIDGAKLVQGLLARTLQEMRNIIGDENWSLIPEEGQIDLAEVAELLIECQLRRASGEDVGEVEEALRAAVGAWRMVARIKVERMGHQWWEIMRDALIEAAGIALGILGAGVRGMVMGV
jgi:hypothetical protein